jgi:hypothetical protein
LFGEPPIVKDGHPIRKGLAKSGRHRREALDAISRGCTLRRHEPCLLVATRARERCLSNPAVPVQRDLACGYSRCVTSWVEGGECFSFRFLGANMRFAWERDAPSRDRAFHFVDAAHARSFLEALTQDERVWPMLRLLLRHSPRLHGEQHLPHEELVELVAENLAHRTLLVTRGIDTTQPGGGKVIPPDRPAPEVVPTTTATFIEIALVDEQGRPVPFERYLVTLPDGTERRGRLDERGLARIDPIRPAGACDITFPDIHGDEWKPD